MAKRKRQKAADNKTNRMTSGFSKKVIVSVLFILGASIIAGILYVSTHPHSQTKPTKPRQTPYTPPQFTKQGSLTFSRPDGQEILTIDIEIADTPEKRRTGMMYRDTVDEHQGMLFIFNNEDYRSFWMSHTLVSLDMIFVNAKGQIVSIQKRAIPFDESTYNSDAPAQYVVEVKGGFCDIHKINPGDIVTWVRYDTFKQ